MPRRALPLLLALSACFEESTPPGSDDDTSGPAATTDGGAATTGDAGADTTSTSPPSTSATTSDATSVDTTGDPPGLCDWPLDWQGTPRKDVLVVVQRAPANLGSVLMDAQSYAGDDLHVAVASSCSTTCGAVAGYEHLAFPADMLDPLVAASMLHGDATIFRPLVPDHVFVLTDVDTMWNEDMWLSDPALAAAQVHVRYSPPGGCRPGTRLEMLAMASGGSFACGSFVGPEILEDDLLTSQPACELFGDVRDGPGPGVPAQSLSLEGGPEGEPASIMLGGPGACGNEPDGWTVVDAPLGHVGLCPIACRSVGRWAVSGLAATVGFECG